MKSTTKLTTHPMVITTHPVGEGSAPEKKIVQTPNDEFPSSSCSSCLWRWWWRLAPVALVGGPGVALRTAPVADAPLFLLMALAYASACAIVVHCRPYASRRTNHLLCITLFLLACLALTQAGLLGLIGPIDRYSDTTTPDSSSSSSRGGDDVPAAAGVVYSAKSRTAQYRLALEHLRLVSLGGESHQHLDDDAKRPIALRAFLRDLADRWLFCGIPHFTFQTVVVGTTTTTTTTTTTVKKTREGHHGHTHNVNDDRIPYPYDDLQDQNRRQPMLSVAGDLSAEEAAFANPAAASIPMTHTIPLAALLGLRLVLLLAFYGMILRELLVLLADMLCGYPRSRSTSTIINTITDNHHSSSSVSDKKNEATNLQKKASLSPSSSYCSSSSLADVCAIQCEVVEENEILMTYDASKDESQTTSSMATTPTTAAAKSINSRPSPPAVEEAYTTEDMMMIDFCAIRFDDV